MSGAGDLNARRRLGPGCKTGDHDVVDVAPGKAVGTGVVLEGGDDPVLGGGEF